MPKKNTTANCPTDIVILNETLEKFKDFIYTTLTKDDVPAMLENCLPGTCLIKTSQTKPNHLLLCILENDKSITYWCLPPGLFSIGINNIILNMTEITYIKQPNNEITPIKKINLTADTCYEIYIRKINPSKLDLYIRNKIDEQHHETDKQFATVGYQYSKEYRAKRKIISASPDLNNTTQYAIPDVVEVSAVNEARIPVPTQIPPKKQKIEEILTVTVLDGKIAQNFNVDNNLTFGDIAKDMKGEKALEYGIFRKGNVDGQASRIKYLPAQKVIDNWKTIELSDNKLFIEPLQKSKKC